MGCGHIYSNKHRSDANTVFSVFLKEKDVKLRIFRGRVRKAARKPMTVRLFDVWSLCELSMKASIFLQMGKAVQQVRGSAIGDQVSPILASLTISRTEQEWVEQNAVFLRQREGDLLILRYVDNRLVLASKALCRSAIFRQLCHLDYYIPPAQLEKW